MPIEVTARHMHDVGDVQSYAKERAEALLEEFSRIEHIHVILDQQKHLCKAEVVVQAKNHIRVEAEESSDNMRSSITTAVAKAEKQLRKLKDKIQDHRPKGKRDNTPKPAEDDTLEMQEDGTLRMKEDDVPTTQENEI